MKRSHLFLGAGVLGVATMLVAEQEARACGGCFTQTETPTVVTDHRMILAVSAEQSTLYDQIQYTGSPASFGWVLPYSGDITVGVSADSLFTSLDNLTQTRIVAPPRNCPSRPNDCQSAFNAKASAAPEDAAGNGGVDVLKHEVVGPYETVQLAATNPTALEEWLAKNGYNVPDEAKPVIAAYQGEHFNFLALKLVPGQGVQDMRPVRVTTKGASVALPLRMVTAGTGATVGITLWVVGQGRYEPGNFDSFQIRAEDIAWDWTQSKSNYIDLRTQKTTASGGRMWEVESSGMVLRDQVRANLNQYYNASSSEEVLGYVAEKDPQGTTTKPASTVQQEDFDTLFAGIAPGSERITRMRADLSHAALDHDLLLKASADQAVLSNVRQVTKELNEPSCPVYDGCEQTGTAPRSQAIATANDNNSGCKVTPRAQSSWLAVGLAFVGLAFARSQRRGHR